MSTQKTVVTCLITFALASSCGGGQPNNDGGIFDGGDDEHDAGPVDAGPIDAGPIDAGVFDAGVFDAGTADGGEVQLNDVSILFPLPTEAELSTALLPANARGTLGELLPAAVYTTVGPIEGSTFDGVPSPGSVGVARYEDLRVVAVRLDPCFGALQPDPHGAGCHNQLRLIFQEVTGSQGTTHAADSGLHVFYRLTRDELLDIVSSVGALRAASRGAERLGGLQPHPIIAAQGPGGAMATGLRQLILLHAGQQNLTRITVLSATQPGFGWSFKGFDFDASLHAAPMQIPTLAGAATSQILFSGFSSQQPTGGFNPQTTSADDFSGLADTRRAVDLTAQQRSTAYDALLRVQNPSKHSPDTIDCGQCHFATPTELLVARPIYSMSAAGNPNAFVADSRFVRGNELAPTFVTGPQAVFNVHAFSYFGQAAGINQRTVNESAAVVAYLNAR